MVWIAVSTNTNLVLALSKWAVEALAEALRLELYGNNIKVSILEPGNYLGGTQILNEERVRQLTDKWWYFSKRVFESSGFGMTWVNGPDSITLDQFLKSASRSSLHIKVRNSKLHTDPSWLVKLRTSIDLSYFQATVTSISTPLLRTTKMRYFPGGLWPATNLWSGTGKCAAW